MTRPDQAHTSPHVHDPSKDRATVREWAGLILLMLPMLTISTDLTVLFLALPTITVDLDPTASQSLWIMHVYGFLIAGFLVTMGRLSDRIGSRRMLHIGAVAFAALSVVAAFSVSADMLIIVRALLGIAGATLMPSLLSLLRTMFRDDVQRRMAIAIMMSSFAVGTAIGPLVGGVLLEFFWWGSVFLISVPPLALLVLLGPRLLPESTGHSRIRLDLVSVALSVTGMLAVVYGLQELAAGQETGEGSVLPNLAITGAGILLLAAFVWRQHRLQQPLFDLGLLTNRRTAVSLITLLFLGVTMTGLLYLLTQFLQWVGGLSPLQAALWTLPYIAASIAGSLLAPKLSVRLGSPVVVAIGVSVAALGAGMLAVVTSSSTPLPLLVAGMSIVGLGHGLAVALVTDLIISHAPSEKTGSAAAAGEVSGELGTALGAAGAGAIGMVAYRSSLAENLPSGVPAEVANRAMTSIHEGVTTAEILVPRGPALLEAVHDAIALGMQSFASVGSALLAIPAVLVMVFIVRRDRARKLEAADQIEETAPTTTPAVTPDQPDVTADD